MLKFKNIVLIFTLVLTLSACSEYSKVLNKGTSAEQYDMATRLYESGKYNKSLVLFEKILPDYQGKPQMERIQYMMSNAKYQTKMYLESAYYFDRFTKNYPKSTKKEEASYMAAMSYFKATLRSSLDQKDTQTAIAAFQKYINNYPDSERVKEANTYVKEMQMKLEKKEFDIAYNYYHTEKYKAAIVAFDNFLSDNLGTSYKEDALYFKSKAAHDLAVRSVLDKKEERINDALKAVERLEYNFKDSKYKNETKKMKEKLNDEMKQLKSLIATNNGN
jgi:outer membrane protein assembly factor BamD